MAHGWTRRGGFVCAVAVGVLFAPLTETALAGGTLVVTPESVQEPPDTVTVSGTCPPLPEEKPPDEDDGGTVVEIPQGGFNEGPAVAGEPGDVLGDEPGEETAAPKFPAEVNVSLNGFDVPQSFVVETDGTFEDSFTLPDPLPPAEYTFQASLPDLEVEVAGLDPITCDGTDKLVVAPFLQLSKDQVVVGRELTASGTCPVTEEEVELRLGDEVVGTGPVNAASGAFSNVAVRIPADSERGSADVRSSCGPTAALTIRGLPVSASSDPPSSPQSETSASDASASESPTNELVEVPDVVGLSPSDARSEVVGANLVPDFSGSGDEVASQDPKAGSKVAAGTTVAVTLGGGPIIPKSITAVVPAWSLVVAIVLAIAAAVRPFVARAARERRERRWVRRAAFRARPLGWQVPEAPTESVPALGVTFGADLDPDPLQFEEVSGVRT